MSAKRQQNVKFTTDTTITKGTLDKINSNYEGKIPTRWGIKSIHDDVEKTQVCDVCGKGFSQAGKLKIHIDNVHSEKEYFCDLCGAVFKQRLQLTGHKKSVHEGEREFTKFDKTKKGKKANKCHICYIAYRLESIEDLNFSFGIHTKQKSYKCDNQLITWLTGITRPAGSCNLVTLKTNFAQYKNFVGMNFL